MLFCLLVSSCSVKNRARYELPEFSSESEGVFEVLTDTLYGFSAISDIAVYEDKVIVSAVNLESGKCIHVFDKNTGNLLVSTLNSGRGPKELLYSLNCNFNQNRGIMTFYDALVAKKLWFQVDSLLNDGLSAVNEQPFIAPKWNRHIVDLEDATLYMGSESYLYRDTSKVSRMELCDGSGNVLSSWNEFPVIDDDRKRFNMYYQDRIAVSPDETHLAVATTLGGILEIFSLKDNIIRNVTTEYFIEPDFAVNENGGYSFNDNTVDSFNDIYATDNRIYAVFGVGVRLKENFAKPLDEQELIYTDIAAFDWEGTPERLIHTDYRIEKLCLNEDADMLYAIVNDIEGNAWLGRIKL